MEIVDIAGMADSLCLQRICRTLLDTFKSVMISSAFSAKNPKRVVRFWAKAHCVALYPGETGSNHLVSHRSKRQ